MTIVSSKMNTTLLLEILFAIHTINIAYYVVEGNDCVELNFKAAQLQGGDSCTLHNKIINDGNILTGDMTDIDATCGDPNCVPEVVKVVTSMTQTGCEVTGGTAVANLLQTVYDNSEAFGHITSLACHRQGECYADIQKGIDYCMANTQDNECMNYVTCDCLMDLLLVMETLGDDGVKEFVKADDSIIDKILEAGRMCRCEDIDSRAVSLEFSPMCALSSKILEEKNLLIYDSTVWADTCNAGAGASCVQDVVDVVGDFSTYGCAVSWANPDFIYTISDSSNDFQAVTNLACNEISCFSKLSSCEEDSSCFDTMPCDCMRMFLAILESLTPESEELLKMDSSLIVNMKRSWSNCQCRTLNVKAASYQNENYCALQNSIMRESSVFAGDSSDIVSTCIEPFACVGNVTEMVAQFSGKDCNIKQETDLQAKFLYNLNNNSDWDIVSDYVCSNFVGVSGTPCYDEMKVAVEECTQNNTTENCSSKKVRAECWSSFNNMVDKLSDKEVFEIDSTISIFDSITDSSEVGSSTSTSATSSTSTADPTTTSSNGEMATNEAPSKNGGIHDTDSDEQSFIDASSPGEIQAETSSAGETQSEIFTEANDSAICFPVFVLLPTLIMLLLPS